MIDRPTERRFFRKVHRSHIDQVASEFVCARTICCMQIRKHAPDAVVTHQSHQPQPATPPYERSTLDVRPKTIKNELLLRVRGVKKSVPLCAPHNRVILTCSSEKSNCVRAARHRRSTSASTQKISRNFSARLAFNNVMLMRRWRAVLGVCVSHSRRSQHAFLMVSSSSTSRRRRGRGLRRHLRQRRRWPSSSTHARASERTTDRPTEGSKALRACHMWSVAICRLWQRAAARTSPIAVRRAFRDDDDDAGP